MKFLAILRDSLRETLDAKVFYVMVVLSLLTVLLAASVTYRPVTMEDRLKADSSLINFVLRNQPGMDKLNIAFGTEKFERLDHRTEPWLGDYRFEEVVRITPREGADKAAEAVGDRLARFINADAIHRRMGQIFQDVEVEKVKSEKVPAGGSEIRFRVTTHGTKSKGREEWYHQPTLFFGLLPLPIQGQRMSDIIAFIVTWIVGTFGAAFTMLVSIVLTASFLPNMLAKGTIDLLLVKPIRRPTLLLYKFMGGLLFMFLNTSIIMVGLWLAIGIQAGVWLVSLLGLIFLYTLLFAILYSVAALVAVLTRNAIVCILLSCLMWAALFAIGWAHWGFIENRREGAASEAPPEVRNHWAFITFDILYKLTPRYKELDWLGNKMLQRELLAPKPIAPPTGDDKEARAEYERLLKSQQKLHEEQLENLDKRFGNYTWASSLVPTFAFIAIMLALACWRFSVKDY